ncbi:hypothetical protein [Micromonospora mirobrigensis]|uniref:hypothetical protein n=1 Tax=Micromonospora mirobrigensis TaxID=262898 RepID=UPI00114CFF1C|nr:hypothetical protein [Micromonospora mirobrigensis]
MTDTVEVLCSPSGSTESALLTAELEAWTRSSGVPVTSTRLADHKDGLLAYLGGAAARSTVLQVTPDVVGALVEAGLLQPPPPDVIQPAVRAALGAAFQVGGELWAAPKDYSLIGHYGRGDAAASDVGPTFMNPVYERIAPFLYAHGGGTVLDGGGGAGCESGNLAGVRRLQGLLREGLVAFPQQHGHRNTVEAAREGAARLALEGPWLTREVPGAWSVASVGELTGGDTTLALAGGWAVTAGADDIAWELVRHLTAPATLERISRDGGPRSVHHLAGGDAFRLLRPIAGARTAIWAWQALIGTLADDPPELLAEALSVADLKELT